MGEQVCNMSVSIVFGKVQPILVGTFRTPLFDAGGVVFPCGNVLLALERMESVLPGNRNRSFSLARARSRPRFCLLPLTLTLALALSLPRLVASRRQTKPVRRLLGGSLDSEVACCGQPRPGGSLGGSAAGRVVVDVRQFLELLLLS